MPDWVRKKREIEEKKKKKKRKERVLCPFSARVEEKKKEGESKQKKIIIKIYVGRWRKKGSLGASLGKKGEGKKELFFLHLLFWEGGR